jgi:GAF domain-containing protein
MLDLLPQIRHLRGKHERRLVHDRRRPRQRPLQGLSRCWICSRRSGICGASMSDELAARRAAATGMLGGDEETYRDLLQSIVDVARTIFGAQAASIFLLDEEADELVFEAVSGQGEGTLQGQRFPSSTGIAGFALVTRQPLVVDDLHSDPRWSRDRAEATGYVPTSIVASPLLHDERALGVLSVLDRAADRPFGLAELELLSRFSTQASIGLDLLLRARRAQGALDDTGSGALVARVAALLDAADDDAGRRLLEALERVLSERT